MIRHSEDAVQWVSERAGIEPNPALGIEIVYGGRIVGGLVYWRFQYEGNVLADCEVTLVLERPQSFTRRVADISIRYPFEGLHTERLTARIAVDNDRSLRIARWLGFVIEGRIRRGRFTDHWLLGMTRDDYDESVRQPRSAEAA